MGSIIIEDFLKSKKIEVPKNLVDLVDLNNIKFLENFNLSNQEN